MQYHPQGHGATTHSDVGQALATCKHAACAMRHRHGNLPKACSKCSLGLRSGQQPLMLVPATHNRQSTSAKALLCQPRITCMRRLQWQLHNQSLVHFVMPQMSWEKCSPHQRLSHETHQRPAVHCISVPQCTALQSTTHAWVEPVACCSLHL